MVQVLLLQDIRKLGHVGDVVNVRPGYARNYLVPQGLATDPTPENLEAIAEARQRAAEERARRNAEFAALIERMEDVGVTIEAAANPEGTLYGSVGAREIATALQAQGFEVLPDHVMLAQPIRTLDNLQVTLEFTEEISTQVKVWVVREGGALSDDESDESATEPVGEDADIVLDATEDE